MSSLSIKNVPDEILIRLRARAQSHHRSLQGEMLAILEEAIQPKRLTIDELDQRAKELGLKTESDSVDIIRADRDAR